MTHYMRWRKRGDPLTVNPTGKRTTPIEARFWKFVPEREPGKCWLFTGSLTEGYGRFKVGNKMMRAHRYAY